MTDRRQKAIEIIARELHKANRLLLHSLCAHEFHNTCYACTHQAETLYDRLSALREFPEEAESMFTELFEVAKAPWVNSAWLRAWGQKFKCSWVGQEGKGTGERRKGQRRVEEPQFMVDTRMVYIGHSREYESPLYTEDRRSEERRGKIGRKHDGNKS